MKNTNNPTAVNASVDYTNTFESTELNIETQSDKERLRELEFLSEVTLDTANCLELIADTPTHLPTDKITTFEEHVVRDNKTSPTNIGLYLASLVAMRDMDILAADQAIEKIDNILTTLDSLEKNGGLFYNWYNTDTGEVMETSNGNIISTVDNAWLAVGLMTIKNASLGSTSAHADILFDAIDISRLYDPEINLFYGHYNASQGTYSAYHNDVKLSETRIASYLGMSKQGLPLKHFHSLGRYAPAGQPEPSHSKQEGIKSWGGSMFEALMPTLFVDEGFSEDLNFAHFEQVRVQIAYGEEHLSGHWGVSVSLTPNDGYQELGIHSNAMSSYYRESSVITPHAKVLALPFAREAAVSGLMKDRADYPGCYKEKFGFCDSIDTANSEVSDTFLALDQAMIFLALYNDWQKDTGGIGRYTSPELISWRSRIIHDIGSTAIQYPHAA